MGTRSFGLLLLALALAACAEESSPSAGPAGGGAAGDGGAGPGGSGGSVAVGGSGGAGGQGDGLGASEGAGILRAMLRGERTAAEGARALANGAGLPAPDDGAFLFVRLDDGRCPCALVGAPFGWEEGIALRDGPGFHWARVPVAAPVGATYKFRTADGTFEPDPRARRYAYDEFGEISLIDAAGRHRERFVEVEGEGLQPRTVRVLVPAELPDRHLYVHDGQNLWEPGGPFGSWRLDEALGPRTLAIGVDNTSARMDEYTHVQDRIPEPVGGQADAYARFVRGTVLPLVEARYGAAGKRGVMGSSLGGLVSFHEALESPESWDWAGSLSGTFGWGSIGVDGETLLDRFEASAKLPVVLYLDSGGGPGAGCVDLDGDGLQDDGDGADNYCETRQLADLLDRKGWDFDVDLVHWWEPDAAHDEAAWAARVFRPVQRFEAL